MPTHVQYQGVTQSSLWEIRIDLDTSVEIMSFNGNSIALTVAMASKIQHFHA
jgi:hypothetical protein